MAAHSARSAFGEPSSDLSRSLGHLLVSSAKLRYLREQLSNHGLAAVADEASGRWFAFADQLLDLQVAISDAAAVMTFTGSAGEHLTVRDNDGVIIPGDAAYIAMLSRRMDRHVRMGRLLLGTAAFAAREPEFAGRTAVLA